jgi:hypothetical protein
VHLEASAVAADDGEVGGSIELNCVGDDVSEDVALHLCWCGIGGNLVLVLVLVDVVRELSRFLSAYSGLLMSAAMQRHVCNRCLRHVVMASIKGEERGDCLQETSGSFLECRCMKEQQRSGPEHVIFIVCHRAPSWSLCSRRTY